MEDDKKQKEEKLLKEEDLLEEQKKLESEDQLEAPEPKEKVPSVNDYPQQVEDEETTFGNVPPVTESEVEDVKPPVSKPDNLKVSDGDGSSNHLDFTQEAKKEKKHGKGVLKVLAGFFLFLFIFGSISGVAVLAAYGKITLPNKAIQDSVTKFVTSIPFMPKTKEQVIIASVDNLRTLKKFSYDISASTDNISSISDFIGLPTSFNTTVKGRLDISDFTKPKGETNLSVDQYIDINLLFKDYFLYFKINELPLQARVNSSVFGFDIEKIQKQWLYYDFTPQKSDASELLKESKKDNPNTVSISDSILKFLLQDDVLSNMTMKKDVLDGHDVYVLDFALDAETLKKMSLDRYKEMGYTDEMAKSASDAFVPQDVKGSIFIDRDSYYIRKMTETFAIKNPSQGLMGVPYGAVPVEENNDSGGLFHVALVVNLSDFNTDFTLDVPSDAKDLNEVFAKLSSEATHSSVIQESSSSNSGFGTTEPVSNNGFSNGFSSE